MAKSATDTALRKAFDEASVTKIAIVDDGYDPPAYADVAEADWQAFVDVVNEEQEFGRHQALLDDEGALPSHGDVRADLLERLWRHLVSLDPIPEEGANPADLVGVALFNVFRSFAGRRLEKLRELKYVEAVALEATGHEPTQLPSSTKASDLVGYDLVFLDYFLGQETKDGVFDDALIDAAKERAQKMVRDTIEAADGSTTPLFVLISSRAAPDTVPGFRDAAQALASKFRFLRKGDIESDRVMAEYVLASLVHQRSAGDAVEQLLRTWNSSIGAAVDDMMASMRRLDVAEYAYLKKYRLEKEQVSLLEYLTWLFNSYLGSFVEERLAGSSKELIEPLSSSELPPAILQPMSEVPAIYSRVTTTQVQNFPDGEPVMVWTGDLFVRKSVLEKAANENVPAGTDAIPAAGENEGEPVPKVAGQLAEVASNPIAAPTAVAAASPVNLEDADATTQLAGQDENPDILAAISPVCDLVPGRESARSILLVGGTLSKPGAPKTANNHMLVIEKPELIKSQRAGFQIEWDPKWPVGYSRSRFDGKGILGTEYVRVGRLRELYAAELAQRTTADIARLGPPVAPPFTHELGVCVLAKNGNQVKRLLDLGPEEGLAWELYATKSSEAREAVFTEAFIWQIREKAAELLTEGVDAHGILTTPEILRPLTVPFGIKNKKYTLVTDGRLIVVRGTNAPAANVISAQDRVVEIHVYSSA